MASVRSWTARGPVPATASGGGAVNGRRDHPRLGITLAATLSLPDGVTVAGRTQNLSATGFQLEVGPEVVRALFPQTRQPGPRERCEAQVSLRDPGNEPAPVEVRCAGVFARRMSQSAWRVGFEFVDPPAPASRWIDGHIARVLDPAEDGEEGDPPGAGSR